VITELRAYRFLNSSSAIARSAAHSQRALPQKGPPSARKLRISTQHSQLQKTVVKAGAMAITAACC
jgi:hypothetical protein